MSYCEKCGSKVSDSAKFCGSCGHKISNSDGKSDKIKFESSSSTSKTPPTDNTLRKQSQRPISKVFLFVLGAIIIVATIFFVKGFDKKSEKSIDTEERHKSSLDLIVDPDEEANAFANDDDKLPDELSFVEAENDDEFKDGLFNFGLQTKSELIKSVLRHLRDDNIIGTITGCDNKVVEAIDRVAYWNLLEDESEIESYFRIEVFQFKNENKLQKSLNEGSLADLKEHGEIYVNDLIVLFITHDYDYNTSEKSNNKIIDSFKSFKNGEISNNIDNNEFTYETYKNNRGYQIDYPSYLKISPTVENGDGTSFTSLDGETQLVVWSLYYAETNDPITESYERDLNEEDLNITYKVKKDTWYSISGFTKTQKIFYKKVFRSEVGAGTVTMYLEYPENEKERYNSILPHIVDSFKDI